MAKYVIGGLNRGTWSEHADVKTAYRQMVHNYRWARRMGWTTQQRMVRVYNGDTTFTAPITRTVEI